MMAAAGRPPRGWIQSFPSVIGVEASTLIFCMLILLPCGVRGCHSDKGYVATLGMCVALSLLPRCCLAAASLLPRCCLAAASLLPRCCLAAASLHVRRSNSYYNLFSLSDLRHTFTKQQRRPD